MSDRACVALPRQRRPGAHLQAFLGAVAPGLGGLVVGREGGQGAAWGEVEGVHAGGVAPAWRDEKPPSLRMTADPREATDRGLARNLDPRV